MDRHKKLSVLPPVCFYKDDFLQLEKLLSKHVNCAGCDLSITPFEHGHEMSGTPFHSFESLFNIENLPRKVDQITIDAKEINENRELVRDAQVFLSRRISYLRVISPEDEEWVTTAFDELRDYILTKKVWYSFLARAIPPIFNSSFVIAFMLSGLAILTDKFIALVFPVVLITCAAILLALNLTGTVYSVARINLFNASDDTRPEYEKYVIWIYLTILIFCIIGALATTWNVLMGAT